MNFAKLLGLLGQLKPDALNLIPQLLTAIATSPDPKKVIQDSIEVAAKVAAFKTAMRAQRPPSKKPVR